MQKLLKSGWVPAALLLLVAVTLLTIIINQKEKVAMIREPVDSTWVAPSLFTDVTTKGNERKLVIYGEELIAHTGKYLGPKGSVLQITNGMACQNCHLDAGTLAWGNNYGAVYSTYPKFRDRSGSVENIHKRVNDCMERSLNGKAIDTGSREMLAIYTYLKWLGRDVPKGKKPYGSGLEKLPFLDRAAAPEKGKEVYTAKCQSCHGVGGEGQAGPDGTSFVTPPLWGPGSYNSGAGLYRLSNFASFVKNNMPFRLASHANPVLSLEEAWDVAAFVNSQPRPQFDQAGDWPDVNKKPVDFPFGPYADTFPEKQHKYGPFEPIENARKKKPAIAVIKNTLQ